MAKQPYHVVPDKSGSGTKWKVKRANATRPLSSHRKKRTAVNRAKKAALNQRVGVIVHRANGTTQYGYDYEGVKRSLGRS